MDMLAAPMTGAEWDHLVDAGLLDGAPVELVGGRKIARVTESSAHAAMMIRLQRLIEGVAPSGLLVRHGHPLALGAIDRPEPDLAVVTARDDLYEAAHPGPLDVHLLVEVSHSSRALDLGAKAQRYAAAGVLEYWVVDLVADVVVVHLRPERRDEVWGSVTRVPFGEPVAAVALDGPIVLPARR